MSEHDEGIASASRVRFGNEEGVNEFWCVRNEGFVSLVDLIDCKDCILPDVGMPMFQT